MSGYSALVVVPATWLEGKEELVSMFRKVLLEDRKIILTAVLDVLESTSDIEELKKRIVYALNVINDLERGLSEQDPIISALKDC